MRECMYIWRHSIRIKHFERRALRLSRCIECETMSAWFVCRIGVDDQCERPSLTAVEARDLIARKHAKPVHRRVREHSACETVNLGAVKCVPERYAA